MYKAYKTQTQKLAKQILTYIVSIIAFKNKRIALFINKIYHKAK